MLDYTRRKLMHSNEICVQPLPDGCRLTAIFDSCHSGTVMDLPYVYSTEGKIKGYVAVIPPGSLRISLYDPPTAQLRRASRTLSHIGQAQT